MIAALFDIDGTLFTAPMGRGFIRFANLNSRRKKALRYLASVMPLYYLYKFKLISEEKLHHVAIERMASLIEGYDLSEGAEVFDWVANEFVFPSGRRTVLGRWEDHRRQGHMLVIVSSGLLPCLERIASRLKAHHVIGTKLEVIAGRYTGRIVPPVMIGRQKGRHPPQFMASRGIEIDWDASYAYADSIHDLPMLELVGMPVAVHPDPSLNQLARRRNWEILPADDQGAA
ncbi:MAG: HAD-IB family hydrolase [Anaerolineales bacterium]|nr:HAD-IB family hydrolase [Anaerolineales bacterium]